MLISQPFIDAAVALVTEPSEGMLPPAAVDFIAAVDRFEEVNGGIRARGAELTFDGRIRTLPALGLTAEEAEAHAYELLVVAHALRTRRPAGFDTTTPEVQT